MRTEQHQTFTSTPIQYGAKTQYAKERSTAPLLDTKGNKFIQQVCGKFLFLGRAVDATLLCPSSAIASQSANPTEDTMAHTKNFLDYVATQEEAVLTYNASDMKLTAHSDASYLSEPKARSRAVGYFFSPAIPLCPTIMVQFSNCTYHQTCHEISNGSGISRTLYHGTQSCLPTHNMRRNGAQTTANAAQNRQRDDGSRFQRQNTTKTNQCSWS